MGPIAHQASQTIIMDGRCAQWTTVCSPAANLVVPVRERDGARFPPIPGGTLKAYSPFICISLQPHSEDLAHLIVSNETVELHPRYIRP